MLRLFEKNIRMLRFKNDPRALAEVVIVISSFVVFIGLVTDMSAFGIVTDKLRALLEHE